MPNLPSQPRERHYVQALYHLTKTLDPTRPVIGNDGWESVATDIIGIHDYDDQPERIAKRYRADDVLPRLFKRERPGGRLLLLDGTPAGEVPLMLTEFGGIALAAANTWGYAVSDTLEGFARQYERMLNVVRHLGLLSGFCYTQFADTYQEQMGCCVPIGRRRFLSVGLRRRPPDRWRHRTTGPSSCNRREVS